MSWYERTARWFEVHRFAVDLTIAALLCLVTASMSSDVFASDPWGDRAGTVAWTVALFVPLPWRRTRPVASAVGIYAVALAHVLLGYPMIMPADLLVLVALYSVTAYGPRWASVVAIVSTGAGSLLVSVVTAYANGGGFDALGNTLTLGVFCFVVGLAVWAFALVRRSRRVIIEGLQERAHRLEIERDQQARIGAATERARIAREMHDIVAHSLSIVVAQADGGRYAASSDPDAPTRALETISETGRTALTDMRRLLGVLRSQDDDDATRSDEASGREAAGEAARTAQVDGAAHRPAPGATGAPDDRAARPAPQPGVADLADLVDQARAGGTRVAFTRIGPPAALPAGMGLTLYRACQESLSNVRKHAGPDPSVTVTVRWDDDTVRLEVLDDGRGAAASEHSEPGFGLRGMRERANLYGGALETGPRLGGGYRVALELPLPGAPTPAPARQTTQSSEETA